MVMLPFLVSGLMASVSVAGPMDIRSSVEHQCGTRSSSLEGRALFAPQNQQPDDVDDDGKEAVIGVVMHHCCDKDKCPPEGVGKMVVDDMNRRFKRANLRFDYENATYRDASDCNCNLDDRNVIEDNLTRFHQGNASTLNIVYLQQNQGRQTQMGKQTTGMCVMPRSAEEAGLAGRADGCVVSMETLPKDEGDNGDQRQQGGWFGRLFGRQNNGDGGNLLRGHKITSTHELGHWLGLDHVNSKVAEGSKQGRGKRNVMEPLSISGADYEFDPEQIRRARSVALGRIRNQDMPITQGPGNRPLGPIRGPGGPGGNNNGRPGTPGTGTGTGTQGPKPGPGNRPDRNPQPPSDDDFISFGDIGTGFPGNKPSQPGNNNGRPGTPGTGTQGPKPGPGNRPDQNPQPPSDDDFISFGDIGTGFPGNKPSKPSNNQDPSGGPNQGRPGLVVPNLPEGTTSRPIPAIEVNSLGNSEGSGSDSFFTPNGPLNARAEPKAKADESGLGNVSGGHVVEGGVDGSGFVVIARK